MSQAQERVIWVRPDSATVLIEYGSGNREVGKFFHPDDITAAHQRYIENREGTGTVPDAGTFRANKLQHDSQRSLFHREVQVLRAFEGYDGVPRFNRHYDAKLRVFMEYVDKHTIHEELVNSSDPSMVEKMFPVMAKFLDGFGKYCDTHRERIIQKANEGRGAPRLKVRSLDEEAVRLAAHLTTILGAYGVVLPSSLVAQGRAGIISEVERRTGQPFHRGITSFVETDRNVANNESYFYHGDFSPQNIFVDQSDEGGYVGVRVCDFDKVQLGGRMKDIASALYNISALPLTERRQRVIMGTVDDYIHGERIGERNATDFKAVFIAHALYELVRKAGVLTAMSWANIRQFVPHPSTTEDTKDSFILHRVLSSLEWFMEYYSEGGDGWKQDVEPSPVKRGLVQKQIGHIQSLFAAGGVTLEKILEHHHQEHEGVNN